MAERNFFLRLDQTRHSDRLVLFSEGGVLTRAGSYIWSREDARGLLDGSAQVHLVEEGDQALLAAHVESPQDDNLECHSLRGLLLSQGDAVLSLAGKAHQIIDWYQTHRHCGACGCVNRAHPEHRALLCPRCGRSYFPRINPCIIVLITRGRQILLARNARYKGRFFSCLAGFIEVGENAEATIHREVYEEVQLRVHNIRYVASQSWPFPSQLMLGYWADFLDGEVQPDGIEIEEARWFDIDDLPDYPSSNFSVAGHLVQSYVESFPVKDL